MGTTRRTGRSEQEDSGDGRTARTPSAVEEEKDSVPAIGPRIRLTQAAALAARRYGVVVVSPQARQLSGCWRLNPGGEQPFTRPEGQRSP
jgi:hypothetical protein